jgi:glycosyltransferase involved in cell wall biosynthesis
VEHAVRLGQDPGLRQRLGQEARRWIERERTWDRLAPGYLRLYGEGA